MGSNLCKTTSNNFFTKEAQKFWKEVDTEKMNTEAKEKVKLTISIKNAISSSKYKVAFLRGEQESSQYKTEGETVEMETNESTIIFPNVFTMDYYFERQQYIGFTIFINSSPTFIKSTLGQVMGSRKQLYIKKLSSGESIEVRGQNIKGNGNNFANSLQPSKEII